MSKTDSLFKNISLAILKKNPIIKIYGSDYKTKDGTAIRDFIHVLDLVRLYLGEIENVQGIITTNHWDIEFEDNAMVNFRSGKAIGSLHSCATLWRHNFEIEIGLSKGFLKITGFLSKSGSYGRETLLIGRKSREGEEYKDAIGFPTEEIRYYDQDDSWKCQVDYWVDCIIEDNPIEMSGSDDALKVMKVIEEVYKQNGINREGR